MQSRLCGGMGRSVRRRSHGALGTKSRFFKFILKLFLLDGQQQNKFDQFEARNNILIFILIKYSKVLHLQIKVKAFKIIKLQNKTVYYFHMEDIDNQSLLQFKQQNPLLKRKPLNLGDSFQNYSNLNTPAKISNPLTAHQVTLLFFGAAWCNITKPFLKQLKAFYNQINLEYKKLEIIYVSLDKIPEEYQQSAKIMPWIGIPCNDLRVLDLRQFYNIKSIPTLLLIDSKGQQVIRDCRMDVYSMGEDEAFEKWKKLKEQQQKNY